MAFPIVSEAATKLESRFVVNALVPTLVFLPLTVATVGQAVWGVTAIVAWYLSLAPALIILIPLGLLALAWLIASLIASQWDRLVTVYEGYPLVWLHRVIASVPVAGIVADLIGVPGKVAHQQRRAKMAEKVRAGQITSLELHLAYTEHNEYVLPTRLGNVLRSAELYPRDRYGIDVTVLWTRLAILLPNHLLTEIERLIVQYQLPLVISAWSLVLVLVSFSLAWAGQITLFLAVLLLASAATASAYYLALPSAQHYGVAIRSVFDVYRGELHAKWDSILPASTEKDDFERLRTFIITGTLPNNESEANEASKSNTTDEGPPHGRRRRKARFRPSGYVPRLRTSACIIVALIALVAWRWSTTQEIRVAVVIEPAVPYEELSVEVERIPLYDAGGRSAELGADVDLSTLVALKHLDEGDVLREGDYVEVDHPPDVVLGITPSGKHIADLELELGDEVTLMFRGSADFESDPECRSAETIGVPRMVNGEILRAPTRSGTIVVGIPDSASLPVRCFDPESVVVVRDS